MNSNSFQRISIPISRLSADANIRPGHPAERACWIWMDGRGAHETAIGKFVLDFEQPTDGPLTFHVTADHRYQLFLDGELISCGPDRCDPAHWAVATLTGHLPAGSHRMEVLAWYLAEAPGASRMDPKHAAGDLGPAHPPMAQMSYRAGFLLCGDADPAFLDTGSAPWKVSDLTDGFAMCGPRNLGYHDIGPEFTVDLAKIRSAEFSQSTPCIVARPPVYNIHGVRSPGWVLDCPSLPEQRRVAEAGGRIRAARPWLDNDAPWSESTQTGIESWQRLLNSQQELEIPASTTCEVLWDLERYECGYPRLEWSGGAGARMEFSWAESLFHPVPGEAFDVDSPRGHRGEIEGKQWLGFGDSFLASGADHEIPPVLWWRSGRYVRLRVRTCAEPLLLRRVGILTTGYPFERHWEWQSSDSGWDEVLPLLARGLELGAHETWVDCPYYEQMMYVGDNIMHALSNYTGYRDDRLTRRSLELFDWSRAGSVGGLVAERYPCAWRQESATYAMLWPMMVRNHLMWRGDMAFVRHLLVGVRQLVESLLELRQENGLLGRVPGWPFVDWVTSWNQGCGPGVREGDSSIVNLHLVLALRAVAEIERAVGDPLLAKRCEDQAVSLFASVMARYWDASNGWLKDTVGESMTSEHAQVLALLTGLLDAERRSSCLRAIVAGNLSVKCTISFSFYLLEALAQAREHEAFFSRLDFWRGLPAQGFLSLPEMPDPCRSDCHGWGAHPLFHSFASIAGIRPAEPAFRSVVIRPLTGPLDWFAACVVHPRGSISLRGEWLRTSPVFEVDLPEGVQGTLVFRNRSVPVCGRSRVDIE